MESSHGSFAANDRSYDSFALSDSLGTQFANLNVNNPLPLQSPGRFNNPYIVQQQQQQPSSTDDRKLTGSGFYKFDARELDTYAFDEFELEDDLEETVRANQNKNELNEVVDNYKRILGESIKNKVEDYQDLINRVEANRKGG